MMKFTLLCESWNGKEQYYCRRIHWTIFPSPLVHYKSHGSSSRNLLQKCKSDPVPSNLGWKLPADVYKSHAIPAYVPGVTLSSVLAADMRITTQPLWLHMRVKYGHLIVISMYSQTPLYWHPLKMDTLLLWTVCFVPWVRKPLHFLYIQPILYGHPVNTHTFYGPSVSVLTEFDCSLSSRFVQNHSAEV